jgi:hypothetical protein
VNLRPLGLGELIDRAIGLWRAHWRSVFVLTVPFQLVQFIVFKVGMTGAKAAFPLVGGDAAALEALKANPAAGSLQGLGFLAILLASVLLTFLILQVGGVATTRFMYPRLVGQPGPSVAQGTAWALSRLGPIVGSFALSLGWTTLVGLLWLSPAVVVLITSAVLADGRPTLAAVLAIIGALLAMAGVVALVVWFIIRFVLMSQIIGVEDGGALVAFRRSAALSSGVVEPGPLGWVKLRLTVLLTIVAGLLLLVGILTAAPTLALGFFYGATLQPGHTIDDVVPQAVLVPVEVLEALFGALVGPIYEAFKVVFYVDMRVRREGLDLALAMKDPAP